LYREVKFQEQLFNLYSKLVELARLDEVKCSAVVPVVDRALRPEKRSNTRLGPAALAGLVTFHFMVFLVNFWEYWQTARLEEETAKRLKLMNEYLEPWRRYLLFWKSRIIKRP
jgi:uncharacterized protein involved in exopolysaccharide biosynthesis